MTSTFGSKRKEGLFGVNIGAFDGAEVFESR